MTLILRRAFFAALLAVLWSAPAFSCKYCDSPPSSPPATLQPAEPLDLRATPGLLPDELPYLQSLDNGRFVRRGSYLDDAKAADRSAHLLTNAAAQSLLKTRAEAVVSVLREKQKSGLIQDADRKGALLLYWYRAPLLAQADREFLSSLNAASLGKAPAGPAWGEKPPGQLVVAGDADGLAGRFLRQVELAGDAEQKASLQEAVGLVLATPTGRQLADEFSATGAKARISFGAFEGSQVLEVNGKKVLSGTYAVTDTSGETVEILVNQDFLKTDRYFRQSKLAPTLAHELLGHGLETVGAKRAGVLDAYNSYYRDNETNARLVGWTVEAELGGKIHTPLIWSYLKDPEAYHRTLQTTLPYYATTVSPAESRDMLGTLQARLERTNEELAATPQAIAQAQGWRPVIEHFVTVHKMDRGSFRSVTEKIDLVSQKSLPARGEALKGIAARLEANIKSFAGPSGGPRLQDMQGQFSRDFFAQEEARVQARRARLEELVRGRSCETVSPPPPGQVSWDELKKMRQDDQKAQPGHWKT
ncbi:MAG: hypothetical protein NTY77_03635 [Elusimicrobia bacterium]|nr:hypothetical protein [Elusimicrobiota bacterium]